MNNSITYADSGVDTKAGKRAVELIKKRAEKTFRFLPGKILSGIGGFSGLYEAPDGQVFGFATDGVGTKLMLAIIRGKHNTVGLDLCAMCFNDLAVVGIHPTFFLDYIAMGKQTPEKTAIIVGGIIDGCEMAQATLIGGEMAEMPGMYDEDDYDMAGFAVGFHKSKDNLILGRNVEVGMKIYGIPSSGVHSNGFSLVRKITGFDPKDPQKTLQVLSETVPRTNRDLGDELLEPTVIYVQAAEDLIAQHNIAGLVHVSGGGMDENTPRILSAGCSAKINQKSWAVPPIFDFIQKKGNVSPKAMRNTFNMGIGMMVISPDEIDEAFLIGEIVEGDKKVIFE